MNSEPWAQVCLHCKINPVLVGTKFCSPRCQKRAGERRRKQRKNHATHEKVLREKRRWDRKNMPGQTGGR